MGDPESVTINVHVPVGESIEGTDVVVPYDDIEDSDSLPKDRATTLLLYCETGRMSAQAGQALLDQGYLEVSHLKGGLAAWRAAGRPTISSAWADRQGTRLNSRHQCASRMSSSACKQKKDIHTSRT